MPFDPLDLLIWLVRNPHWALVALGALYMLFHDSRFWDPKNES